jgi:hypothetical protein
MIRFAIMSVLFFTALNFNYVHSFSTTTKPMTTTTMRIRSRNYNNEYRKHQIGIGSIRNGRSFLSPSILATTTSLSSDTSVEDYNDPYVTANKIDPHTQTISESLSFFAKFLVNHFCKQDLKDDANDMIRRKTKIKEEQSGGTMWKNMNEQRRNIMQLAGYGTSFVIPSFGFLFLGALMTSIVPSYWGKCIQCVATMTATKTQLVEALVGLGVTSTLAALFTGIRGSLFWIGGTCRHAFLVIDTR